MNTLGKLFIFLWTIVFLPVMVMAQVPGAFNYQAMVRNTTGQVLPDQNVSLKISIVKGILPGTVAYSEVHNTSTNAYGMINLQIGTGTVLSGDMNAIEWDQDIYHLRVEMDPSGGTNYAEMGTSRILSVPYALFSGATGNVDDADADPANEFQALRLSGDTIYLENGGFVKLPPGRLGNSADIDTSGIQAGDLLTWDGNKWIPGKPAGLLNYYYADRDGDGDGDKYSAVYSPEAPQEYVETNGDCDDNDPEVNTSLPEVCDGKDNNCDGEVDEGCDDDMDGIFDDIDNCPLVANPTQANNDGDALGDACDPDDDNDTVLDGVDNCPLQANSTQANNDGDVQGDACDPDDDNDGVADTSDNCPLVYNPDQKDTDKDGVGDVCDSD